MFSLFKKLFRKRVKDESPEDQLKEIKKDFWAFKKLGAKSPTLREDCDELSNAHGEFGHSLTNPVPVNGVKGSIKYLSRLRCKCGVGLIFHRLGSAASSKTKYPIDVYETVCSNGKHWDILFLHIYHPRRSTFLPKNYSFAKFHPIFSRLPIAFGTNYRTLNFPFSLSNPIIKYLGKDLGRAVATRYERIVKDKSRFQRPADQQSKLKQASDYLSSCITLKSKPKIAKSD